MPLGAALQTVPTSRWVTAEGCCGVQGKSVWALYGSYDGMFGDRTKGLGVCGAGSLCEQGCASETELDEAGGGGDEPCMCQLHLGTT